MPQISDSQGFYILQFSRSFLRDSVPAEEEGGTRNFPLEWLNAPYIMFLTAISCFTLCVLQTFNAMLALETNQQMSSHKVLSETLEASQNFCEPEWKFSH